MKSNEKITRCVSKIINHACRIESLGTSAIRVIILGGDEASKIALSQLERKFNVTSSFEYDGNIIATAFIF